MDQRSGGRLAGLGARVHLFVRPDHREAFTALFRDVLESEVVERDFGLQFPILLVKFPDGSAFSVEFSDLATESPETVNDSTAFRGAWIEFRTADVEGLQQRLRDAGIPSFTHAGSPHTYFAAPGGQVFRLLDLTYHGP
jgi:hypothetical protein